MSILKTLGDFVKEILTYDESKIIIARTDYIGVDFNDDIIVIDMLNASPVGRSNSFDGDNEKMDYVVKNKAVFTIDFYGESALLNGNTFIARLNSQLAYEFARDNQIEVYHNTSLINIKKLQGKTTYDRYQVEIMVKYSEQLQDDVRRIDTAEYTIITNN